MANGLGVALALGAFVVFALCLIGLFKPKFLQFNKSGEPPKRSHIAIALVFLPLLMFGIGGSLLDPVEKQEAAQTSSPSADTSSTPVAEPVEATGETASVSTTGTKANLGLTPEEFRKAYNDLIGQIDRSWRLPEFDITQGSVNDTFTVKTVAGAGMVGSVNKQNQQLQSVMVIVGGGQGQDNLKSMAVLLSAVHTLTKSSSKEEVNKAVTSLMNQVLDEMNDSNAPARSVVLGNRKLSATASPVTGLMFSVGVVE